MTCAQKLKISMMRVADNPTDYASCDKKSLNMISNILQVKILHVHFKLTRTLSPQSKPSIFLWSRVLSPKKDATLFCFLNSFLVTISGRSTPIARRASSRRNLLISLQE
mmetsp:Transcript_32446/g.37565  ORF Transcript_32446/g.37565 Transcript_32446/m.37565 type:complete len:109 (+) Transcript_32446:76-402(+)